MLLKLTIFAGIVSRRTAATVSAKNKFGFRDVRDSGSLYRRRRLGTILDCGKYKFLPEEYKKFFREWKKENPKPVHFIPQEGKYFKDERSGIVRPVRNYYIPLKSSDQQAFGIWGGESLIAGWKRLLKGEHRVHDLGPCPKFWYPSLERSVVYSEVLDLHVACDVTKRALVLINEHCGLDSYLLETRACDLRNLLAIKLKRKILNALHYKTLYKNDELKRKEVYNKYKKYLDAYTAKEIDWYGLTLPEALIKKSGEKLRERENSIVPLKHQYRKEFIEDLKVELAQGLADKPKPWYKKKLLPFK